MLQHLGGLGWLLNPAGRLAATVWSEEGRKLIYNPAKQQVIDHATSGYPKAGILALDTTDEQSQGVHSPNPGCKKCLSGVDEMSRRNRQGNGLT